MLPPYALLGEYYFFVFLLRFFVFSAAADVCALLVFSTAAAAAAAAAAAECASRRRDGIREIGVPYRNARAYSRMLLLESQVKSSGFCVKSM